MKKNYDLSDLIKCWKKLKIRRGDTVYITGDLLMLGFYADQKNICRDYLKTLKSAIGPKGTIIFPTHSWSLVKSRKFFSLKNTPSETGVLTEFLRKQKKSHRQFHPFSSTSALGYHAKFITNDSTKHVYGINSPFDKLVKLNAKNISIGLTPNLTCTQIHHAELMSNVPYRYVKEFNKNVQINNRIVSKKFYLHCLYHSLRKLDRDRNNKIFSSFLKKNKLHHFTIGKSKIYSYSLTNFYKDTLNLMKKNIYVWLKKIPKNKPWMK